MKIKRIMIWNCFLFAGLLGLMLSQEVKAENGNDQPRVMVTGYELEDGGISPGETNQLTITLKNMNKKYSVFSILITGASKSDDITTKYGTSNQAYIETIEPEKEEQAVINLVASDTLDAESIDFTLKISYKDDIRGITTTELIINIPVKQDHLKIQRAYIPQTAVVGVNSRISVTYENIENEEIYNTVMTVTGSGMEESSVEIGTIVSQERKNQEVYIHFDSSGEQSVSVLFIYEDAEGKSYTTGTQSYQVDVSSKMEDSEEANITAESIVDDTVRIKQLGCIIVLAFCILGIMVIIHKEKKR